MWLTERTVNHFKILKSTPWLVCFNTWPSRPTYSHTRPSCDHHYHVNLPNQYQKISTKNPKNKKTFLTSLATQLFLEAQTRMEASCSTGSNVKRRAPMRCYCNKKPIIVVSWISDNPGRRFYGCPNYWVNC